MLPRLAQPSDLPGIAALQADSWRRTYRGFLSDDFLDRRLDGVMADLWTETRLAQMRVRIAGDMAGFVSLRQDPDAGFIDNLHVAMTARRSGHGAALLSAARADAQAAGLDRLWLTVMTGNPGARAFYRAMGGIEGPPHQVSLFDHPVEVVAVTWTDLAQNPKNA